MEDRPENDLPDSGSDSAADASAGGDNGGDGGGMSTGMKVGIGIGILVAALLLIVIFMQLAGGSGGSAPEESTPESTAPEVPIAATATPGTGEAPSDGIIIIIPTPEPGDPTVTANTGVYIRSGPGTIFTIIGALAEGESAEAVGRTEAGDWWAILMPDESGGVGWVSAQYVTATDADSVSVVQPPPVPTATATPPVAITDWKGEYFDNQELRGNPVLTRNDERIDFNWGSGSPAPEVPNDHFSVRWTMSRNAPRGVYEFSVWVDDGVRVWVDEQLVINGWAPGPARNYNAKIEVADGAHNVRIEYFEDTGGAMISLGITYRGEAVPEQEAPVAVISGPTEGVVGEELFYSASGSTVQEGSHIVSTEWDFGDGTIDSGADVVHVYANPGVYTVLLALTDDKGLSGTTTQQVRISAAPEIDTPIPEATEVPPEPTEVPPEPTEEPTEAPLEPTEAPAPVANIVAPAQAAMGDVVTFDGSQSVSVNPIQSYVWDLGDGTPAEGAVVEHIYAAEGTFIVTLTVIDSEGLTGQTSMPIQVTPGEAVPLPETDGDATQEPAGEGAGSG